MGSRATKLLVDSRHAEALAVADDLVVLARKLGIPEYEGLGLALVGDARVRSGDLTGRASFAQGMGLMETHRFPMRIWAAFGHARSLWVHGDLPGCAATLQEGRGMLGTAETAKAWFAMLDAGLDHTAGHWDAVLGTVAHALASERAQQERFPVSWGLILRGRIRLARSHPDGALADARAAFEAAGEVRIRQEARALLGRALLATHGRAAAADCATQLLAEQHQQPERASVTPDLVRLLTDLGDPPAGTLPERLPPTSWHRAAQAFLAGQYRQAAELFDTIGSRVDAAYSRLCLARALCSTGRHPEALAALDAATEVFQQAGATAELDAAKALRDDRTR